MERPTGGKLVIDTPVPILANDTISLLGAGEKGVNLTWKHEGGSAGHNSGPIVIELNDHLLNKVRVRKLIEYCLIVVTNIVYLVGQRLLGV